jgi:hypothetical protein
MDQYLLHEYLPAFAATVVTELGVAMLLGFWGLRQLAVVVLMHFVTHPALHLILWAGYWWHGASPSLAMELVLEMGVVVAEGSVIRWLLPVPARKALAASAAMNTTSYLMGFVLVP